jgi:hypothetical protein
MCPQPVSDWYSIVGKLKLSDPCVLQCTLNLSTLFFSVIETKLLDCLKDDKLI